MCVIAGKEEGKCVKMTELTLENRWMTVSEVRHPMSALFHLVV